MDRVVETLRKHGPQRATDLASLLGMTWNDLQYKNARNRLVEAGTIRCTAQGPSGKWVLK